MKKNFLFLFLIFVQCAHQESRPPVSAAMDSNAKAGQKIESAARPILIQGEKLFQAKKYDQARAYYQEIKAKYPRGRAHMISSYRLGTIYYFYADYPAASNEFENFLNQFPSSELRYDVTYNLAATYYQMQLYDRSYQTLGRLKLAEVHAQGAKRAEIVYELTAKVASKLGNHKAVVAALSHQLMLPQDNAKRTQITQNIDSQLSNLGNISELENLLVEVFEPSVKIKIAQRIKAIKEVEGVEAAALPKRESIEQTPLPPTKPNTGGNRFNIGVILPLSGKNAAYGKKALDGILLASGSFQAEGESGLKVFVEDSASNPLVAEAAVDSLINKHEVIAIIGPLSFKESVAVANKAQRAGVPNLSLSTKEGISDRGNYLFQNALTSSVQLEELVDYCVKTKEMKRFAILAPSDNFGRDMENDFWNYVERAGGKVVAYQSYVPGESDFQSQVQELTGLSNPRYRKLEAQKMDEFVRTQKERTGKAPKIRLPPIVDFDALFIPDSPKVAAQVAASLAYFDVTGLPLLGTSEWNTDQLYQRGGRYVEGAIFPGGLNVNTRDMQQKEFIRSFTENYGSIPDLLNAQAYEAVELIAWVLKKGADSRSEVAKELSEMKGQNTVLGMVSFDSHRLARRKLPIYTLGSGGVISGGE